jgi:hypothetical protein
MKGTIIYIYDVHGRKESTTSATGSHEGKKRPNVPTQTALFVYYTPVPYAPQNLQHHQPKSIPVATQYTKQHIKHDHTTTH